MHLMRWQQLFPQIFLCSYPFRVHLQSIFVAGASWKVDQGKTKPTLLTYVRSEEDNPLRLTPLDIYTLYYQLWGSLMISSPRTYCYYSVGLKPNAKAQVFAPPQNAFKQIQKILSPSKFPISFIHLAYTPLHIKGRGHVISLKTSLIAIYIYP